ncbi:MAG TPA: hypothetical protein VFL93_11625 [Longimicrobiaceae bacterium]|nr:hypothetical protein [Longimicrobiaceae bacterium]
MPNDSTVSFPVGLEEGPRGATRVHSLSVPGCVAEGATRDEALAAFPIALAEWLELPGMAAVNEDQELEIAVDEWIRTDANVAAGESDVTFDADLRPLTDAEIDAQLRTLGDLRGRLLRPLRRTPDARLDELHSGEWTLRRVTEELARAQWWLLTRLGASPLAEVPERTIGRLDTAMALVVQHFTALPAGERARVLELDGESWTPRKVLRRLLWLEWSLGRSALRALPPE